MFRNFDAMGVWSQTVLRYEGPSCALQGVYQHPPPPPDAGGTSPRFPSRDNLECLQTLTNVPWVEKSGENHHAEETVPGPSPKPTAALSPRASQGRHLLRQEQLVKKLKRPSRSADL